MDIKGKVALVTGGNRGIGRAISLLLSQKGVKVALNYSSSEASAAKVVDEITRGGGEAMKIQADIASPDDSKAMIAAVIDHFGRLDFVVNNAGTVGTPKFLEITEEDWDRVLDINLKGVFNCCQAAMPGFLEQGGGKIVNISSIAGKMGGKSGVQYAASKAGVIGLTMALATEFANQNIWVNAVTPGPVRTDMFKGLTPELQKMFADTTLVGRVGEPDEIAHAVVFLLENDFVNGETLNVSGGRYLD